MKTKTTAVLALALTLLPAGSASAYTPPGRTFRISLAADGAEAESRSASAAMAGGGRFVAFTSEAPLDPADTNGDFDIYVRDLVGGGLERVSVPTGGGLANGHSLFPSISDDGRIVAWHGDASNLVPGDTNAVEDVFMHDRSTGVTKRISVPVAGGQADAYSRSAVVSGDGRFIGFWSESDVLVPGDRSPYIDVFLYDVQQGTLEMVSVDSRGLQSVFDPGDLDVSQDGRFVTWSSPAPTTEIPDANAILGDVFVRDRSTGTTERISDGLAGMPGDNFSLAPSISDDGRYVAFASLATNLVPDDTNGRVDVFLHDRTRSRTERISVSALGEEVWYGGGQPQISGNGRFVAFNGVASELVPGPDPNGGTDAHVHDRLTGEIERVSVDASGIPGDAISISPSISDDGRLVAFSSAASDLVEDDTNFVDDVFVHDRGPAIGVGGLTAGPINAGSRQVSGWARFTGSVMSSVTDPAGDAVGDQAGLDIVGGALVVRPELEDMLVRVELGFIPDGSVGAARRFAGAPFTSYLVSVTIDGVRWDVRATPAPQEDPATPTFVLSRCTPACTTVGPVPGAYGTTGAVLLVSLPLETVGATPGSWVISAGVSAIQATPGVNRTADSISFTGGPVPVPTVALGTAAAGTPGDQVPFSVELSPAGGRFEGSVGAGEDHDVWARACLGSACGATSA